MLASTWSKSCCVHPLQEVFRKEEEAEADSEEGDEEEVLEGVAEVVSLMLPYCTSCVQHVLVCVCV